MRANTRTTMGAVLATALAAGTLFLVGAPPAAANILPTTTTLTTSANPVLASGYAIGGEVTYTASVSVLGTNLFPVTPSGTVTFTVNGEPQPPVPLGSCALLTGPCKASITVETPGAEDLGDLDDWGVSEVEWTVSARYNGDLLSTASVGTLSPGQQFVVPKQCNSKFSCQLFSEAPDGSAFADINVDDDGLGNDSPEDPYVLFLEMISGPLTCSRPNTGAGVHFEIAPALPLTKELRYVSLGQAAVNASSDVWRVCWQSDQVFTTRSGVPATPVGGGMYEGLLPRCTDEPAPCIDTAWYDSNWDSLGPRLQTVIEAPPGDPRAMR